MSRIMLILESWLCDAMKKADFHGQVSIDVDLKGGKIVGATPRILQTVRNFDD